MPEQAPQQGWNIYILQCGDDSLYTGITTDLERRLAEHRSGRRGAKYLRGREPLQCVFQMAVSNRSEASRLEFLIKRMPRERKQLCLSDVAAFRALLTAELAAAGYEVDQ